MGISLKLVDLKEASYISKQPGRTGRPPLTRTGGHFASLHSSDTGITNLSYPQHLPGPPCKVTCASGRRKTVHFNGLVY